MKKIKLFGISLACLSLVGGGLVFSKDNKVLESFASNQPVGGTVGHNFALQWPNPNVEYLQFTENDTIPLYYNNIETNLFSATVNKNTANEVPKLRYKNNVYSLFLKYSNSKTTLDSIGGTITYEASSNYVFERISGTFVNNYNKYFAVWYSNNGSDWTKATLTTDTTSSFSVDLPTQSKYVKIGNIITDVNSHEFTRLTGVSLDFINPALAKYVTFDSQGGSSVEQQIVAANSYAEEPANPSRPQEGSSVFTFNGWHTDPTAESPFNFSNTPITNDITLYAHWSVEVLSGYTITFDTRGGSAVPSQTVPIDGETLFTKPSENPTKASDSKYNYTFKDWYKEPEFVNRFDFTKVPTGNVTAYAGFTKQGYAPSGYATFDPKKHVDEWGASYGSTFQALELDTYDTNDPYKVFPAMHISVSQSGESNAGAKITTGEFDLNSADVVLTITDLTKYLKNLRIEFYVRTYNASTIKEVTIKSKGIAISETGILPHDSVENCDLVLDCDCSSKPREIYFHIGYMSSNGVRLRYMYGEVGTYTAEEQAVNFATAFNDANVCGTSATDGLNETRWTKQVTAFSTLSSEAKAIFNNYSGSNAEILECLERFDRVIYLHGEDYDFMGRIESDNIPTISSQKIGLFVSNITHNNSSIVLIVLSSFSVLAITAFFVTRRKEND